MQLGAIIHATADKSYEDLRVLQAECVTASDTDRKRKIIDYCETQRHRALQLLALVKYAENDAGLVRRAIENVGEKATSRLEKYRQTYWALDNSVNKFEVLRMPKYDVSTAASALVNREFKGFPLVVETLLNTEDTDELEERIKDNQNLKLVHRVLASKKLRTSKDRILSRLLTEELDLANDRIKNVTVGEEGDLSIDCTESAGYLVKLVFDSIYDHEAKTFKNIWQPSYIRLAVRSEDRDSDSGTRIRLHKHIARIGDLLQKYLETTMETGSTTIQAVHSFMRTLCASLVFQILEAETSASQVQMERTPQQCKIALNIKNWFLLIRRSDDAEPSLLTFTLLHNEKEFPVRNTLDGSNLDNLSLRRLIAAAIRSAAQHQLEHLREIVLQNSPRRDASHARVRLVGHEEALSVHDEFHLELNLFYETSMLVVKMGREDAFELWSTSKASRFGHYSVDELLKEVAQTLKAAPSNAWGPILGRVWDTVEAWDCLTSLSIPGVTTQRSSHLPPDVEIARNKQRDNLSYNSPAVYWNLGCFEGMRYFFAVQYTPPSTVFDSSSLPVDERISHATQCEVLSMALFRKSHQSKSAVVEHTTDDGAAGVMDTGEVPPDDFRSEKVRFSSVRDVHSIYQIVRSMRLAWAEYKFKLFGMYYSTDDRLWHGGNSSDIQSLSPYMIEFADEGDESSSSCKILCRANESFVCKRVETLDASFAAMIRKRGTLKRLARCSTDRIAVIEHPSKNYCTVNWRDRPAYEMLLIGFESRDSLGVIIPKPHPLEKLVEEELNRDNSFESFRFILSLWEDSNRVIGAAEDHARRHERRLRITASSITNLHFFLDHPTLTRLTFDCRLLGDGKATLWNRVGWTPPSLMMTMDSITPIEKVIAALRE